MPNIVSLVQFEHEQVKQLLSQFREEQEPTRVQQLWKDLAQVIMLHSAKERKVLYPALRDLIGSAKTDMCLKEHQEVEEQVNKIPLDSDVKRSKEQCIQAVETFLAHALHEESNELPALADMQSSMLAELATMWQSAPKKMPAGVDPKMKEEMTRKAGQEMAPSPV